MFATVWLTNCTWVLYFQSAVFRVCFEFISFFIICIISPYDLLFAFMYYFHFNFPIEMSGILFSLLKNPFTATAAKDPVPVKCPVAGKFNFTQTGELRFETRILGGVTKSPWDHIYCRENISDLSVCDQDQKEIWIDAHYCISVDAYGRHVDIYCTLRALALYTLSSFF